MPRRNYPKRSHRKTIYNNLPPLIIDGIITENEIQEAEKKNRIKTG